MDWMRTGFPRYCRNMHYPQCYFLELRRHDPVQESLVFHHIRWICFPILSDNTFRFHTKSKSLVSRCNVRNRTFLRSADLGMSEQHCYTAPAHFDFSVSDRQYAKMWTKYGPAHPRACWRDPPVSCDFPQFCANPAMTQDDSKNNVTKWRDMLKIVPTSWRIYLATLSGYAWWIVLSHFLRVHKYTHQCHDRTPNRCSAVHCFKLPIERTRIGVQQDCTSVLLVFC
jgi:hypothetical protein